MAARQPPAPVLLCVCKTGVFLAPTNLRQVEPHIGWDCEFLEVKVPLVSQLFALHP